MEQCIEFWLFATDTHRHHRFSIPHFDPVDSFRPRRSSPDRILFPYGIKTNRSSSPDHLARSSHVVLPARQTRTSIIGLVHHRRREPLPLPRPIFTSEIEIRVVRGPHAQTSTLDPQDHPLLPDHRTTLRWRGDEGTTFPHRLGVLHHRFDGSGGEGQR